MKLSAAGFNARHLSLNQAEAPRKSFTDAARQHVCCMFRPPERWKVVGESAEADGISRMNNAHCPRPLPFGFYKKRTIIERCGAALIPSRSIISKALPEINDENI
jgi:hypothetical protein